jgi:hypothetical protein
MTNQAVKAAIRLSKPLGWPGSHKENAACQPASPHYAAYRLSGASYPPLISPLIHVTSMMLAVWTGGSQRENTPMISPRVHHHPQPRQPSTTWTGKGGMHVAQRGGYHHFLQVRSCSELLMGYLLHPTLHIDTRTYIPTYIHIYIYMHTHVYTYTYTYRYVYVRRAALPFDSRRRNPSPSPLNSDISHNPWLLTIPLRL